METLPDHILEKIFLYLDLISLKNAKESFDRWSSIIEDSQKIGRQLTIIVTGSSNELTIPIVNLKYENLEIRDGDALVDFPNVFRIEKHRYNIRKVTLNNFISYRFMHNWHSEITHLIIKRSSDEEVKRRDQDHLRLHHKRHFNSLSSSFKPDLHLTSFKYLVHLEATVDTFNRIDNITPFGWLKDNRLKHLSIHVRKNGSLRLEAIEDFANFLDVQIQSLSYLSISGINLNEAAKKCISNGKNLMTLELELCELTLDPTTLNAISSLGAWKQLIFKQAYFSNIITIEEVAATCEELDSLVIQYESNTPINPTYNLLSIPNLLKIEYHDLPIKQAMLISSIRLIEIKRIDTAGQMEDLIEFTNSCVNLVTLKINMISTRANPNEEMMKNLLTRLKKLKELHLGSIRLIFTYEMLNVIKTELKNLQKLIVTVDKQKQNEMRRRLSLFNDTEVRTIVLERTAIDTCLENGSGKATCVWKR